MNRHISSGPRVRDAFTLIEMLVVITIIGLLIALAVPALTRTMEANRLTAAGEGLTNRLSQAQQLASSKNRRMQIWFICSEAADSIDNTKAYRSYAICEVPSDGQQAKVIAGPFAVESGVVIVASDTLSPLLGESPGLDVPAAMASASDPRAKAAVIELSPDGGMKKMKGGGQDGLMPEETDLARSYITLVSDNPAELSATLPKNFYTVQIDPYTSRARTFRPTIN